MSGGPLSGIRVVEFAGIGPGPYVGQLLADMGAEVLVIERERGKAPANPVNDRGKARWALDIRDPQGRDAALDLLGRADVLVEGFRPGVMERLGLGPDVVRAANPRLIYGRMTGWGQDGPLAQTAGHDITYLAPTGALAAMGPAGEAPVPPLNLVGDFGGGALFLAFGIAAALVERATSGEGQVIDAAIVDGVASMMGFFAGFAATGLIPQDRGRNMLGGAAPFYRSYVCADGRYLAVGAIEPAFLAELLARLGAPADLMDGREDPANWPAQTQALAAIFATRPRDEWAALLEGGDACAAGVLALDEAPGHPHLAARGVYETRDGVLHPAPAPRFSRTPGAVRAAEDAATLRARWAATPAIGPAAPTGYARASDSV